MKKEKSTVKSKSPSIEDRRERASVATTEALASSRSVACDSIGEDLHIISDYVTEGLLALDPAKPLAVIDWRLHLMYADDEAKLARWPWPWLIRMGLIERDVRYRRLLKMVVLYIELMRGRLQSDYEARLILSGTPRNEAHAKALERYGVHTGPLHFIVTGPDAKPLLLGTYDGVRIGFAEAEKETPSSSPSMGSTADIADVND